MQASIPYQEVLIILNTILHVNLKYRYRENAHRKKKRICVLSVLIGLLVLNIYVSPISSRTLRGVSASC